MDTNKKRKLLIIGSSQGVYGGIEAFMIALSEAVIGWPELEIRLCFKIVKGYRLTEELKASAEKICSEVYYVNRGSPELFKLIKWAEILHVQNAPPDVVIPARFWKKKVVLTIHNRRIAGNSFYNAIWGLTMKLANRRWFNSNFVWSTWEGQRKSTKSECVPTICRLPNVSCTPNKRKGFIFIGRWIENKGMEELISAYALNRFDPKECPLKLIGDGPLKPKILGLLNELKLDEVQILGFVSDDVKAEHLASARWLVAPAKVKEDLGLTPIEARNAGVPSIVANDGGLPEAGGLAAILTKPGDVTDLARCLNIAACMNDNDYSLQADLAKRSLEDFLKPIEFYRSAYTE